MARAAAGSEGARLAGAGATGLRSALDEMFPQVRYQRSWFHEIDNVLNMMPKIAACQGQGSTRRDLERRLRVDAIVAFNRFVDTYAAKYPKAVEKLIKDRDTLLAFYYFSAEHWQHVRTTTLIESTRDGAPSHVAHAQLPVARDIPRHGFQADRGGRAVLEENPRRQQERAAPEGHPLQRRNPDDRERAGSPTAGRLIMPSHPRTPELTIDLLSRVEPG
ncbi:transposase [Burkholderia territorii]|uniref:transposase n=1 Tax=Burkholderia territorii TaxID=1503055 RepID=UPI0009BFDD9A